MRYCFEISFSENLAMLYKKFDDVPALVYGSKFVSFQQTFGLT